MQAEHHGDLRIRTRTTAQRMYCQWHCKVVIDSYFDGVWEAVANDEDIESARLTIGRMKRIRAQRKRKGRA